MRLSTGGLIVGLIAVFFADAGAAVHRVPGQWRSIQGAIDAAAAGDTVVVACGTYFEHDINVKSGIYLTSETGSPSCATIDAQRRGRVLHCSNVDATTVIEGFTITGGLTPGDLNQYSNGAGAYLSESSPTIRRCLFTRNEANWHGAGVYCSNYSSPLIENVRFEHNIGHRGGGVYCYWGSSPTLEDVVFLENTTDLFGGGMYITDETEPTLTRVQFIRNTADFGGGARCDDYSRPVFTEVLFEDNYAAYFAGGLNVMDAPWPVLDRVVFRGNAAGERGGAMEVYKNAHPQLMECTFYGNEAPRGSGIFFWDGGWPVIRNTIVAFGGGSEAVHCTNSNLHAVFQCCDIYGNEGGDWTGEIAAFLGQSGNICADPRFCLNEYPEEPLTISESSPCAPSANPECGLIGAFGVSCTYTATEATSWGLIKAMYR